MISFVKGQLAEVLDGKIVIETGGLGIEINVPTSVLASLPSIGEELKIYTYFRVSEDAMNLYGFNSRRDQEMFEALIGVSGIGPKGALAILSALSPDELRMAILNGDAKIIATAQGIGAKTAQRVILDLKDKVDIGDVIGTDTANAYVPQSSVKTEAIQALVSLGYSSGEVSRVIREIDSDDLETLINEALTKL